MARKANPTTRFYEIRPGSHGWARIWITDDGCFTCLSDWGNYGYWWGSPGCEFRQFLTICDDDYLTGKLAGGKKELNGTETVFRIQEGILSLRRCGAITREEAREEWDRLPTCFEHDVELSDWLRETDLSDAWEYALYERPRQLQEFVKHIWPLFVARLKHELESEEAA